MSPRPHAAGPLPAADENAPNFPSGVPILPLHSLGQRIAILGPSNAGKSTLAVALSKKLGIPAVHLDQLHHLPGTHWQSRPEAEFAALHDAAIHKERWIIEGSYSRLMPQRLARATGVIVITSNHWLRFFRYLKRTLATSDMRMFSRNLVCQPSNATLPLLLITSIGFGICRSAGSGRWTRRPGPFA
ncbi:hypothetical protein [Rhizobium leguminosarum]|uniref:hypothetical protein n=1 Tax=Rhizobium leguminosarum TaxID=384 RepID=UPI0028F43B65|nr:hypothetical protein [Rhizobium leguminosarum]